MGRVGELRRPGRQLRTHSGRRRDAVAASRWWRAARRRRTSSRTRAGARRTAAARCTRRPAGAEQAALSLPLSAVKRRLQTHCRRRSQEIRAFERHA